MVRLSIEIRKFLPYLFSPGLRDAVDRVAVSSLTKINV